MDWNTQLFLWLNTSATTASAGWQALVLALALFCAKYFIFAAPAALLWLYARGGLAQRRAVLCALAACALAYVAAMGINAAYPHPRPFMLGLGQMRMGHAPTPSFPSHHLTAWWAVAFSLCGYRSTRVWGIGLALLGLPMAWARIYMGVHFPLDMLGAAGLAAISAGLIYAINARGTAKKKNQETKPRFQGASS
jgi:undecaprenyl-diphosphatase